MKRRRGHYLTIAMPQSRRRPEPTIGLINIVFLMLIFFLIAGTLASPLPAGLDGVESEHSPPTAPPDALAVAADGTLYNRGQPTDLATFATRASGAEVGGTRIVRLYVDKTFPARDLVGLVAALRERAFDRVVLVAERAQ